MKVCKDLDCSINTGCVKGLQIEEDSCFSGIIYAVN